MITIGIIGLGYWGPNYVRVFDSLPESEVCYCCDTDTEILQNMKISNRPLKVTSNYQELLSDPEVEAVVISTPASTHYQIAKECLEQGKDALVEKPFTLSSKEAEELVELARRNKRVLMVAHTFEYNPAVHKLKEYVSSGDLGHIYYLHFSRTGLGPIRKDTNAMWDLAPHDISMLLYLTGDLPLQVSATGQSYLQQGIEDVVFLTLTMPHNILASIHVSWLDPYKIRNVTVVGSERMAVFDDINKIETLKIFDKGVQRFGEKSYAEYGEFQLSVRDGDIVIPKIEMSEPLKNQCLHFLECIKEGKQPLTDGQEGLKVVKILEAGQESLHNNGQAVKVRL